MSSEGTRTKRQPCVACQDNVCRTGHETETLKSATNKCQKAAVYVPSDGLIACVHPVVCCMPGITGTLVKPGLCRHAEVIR